MNPLRNKIKILCNQRKITLKEMAEKMGVAPESLSRMLDGNPTLATLQIMAKSLNVNIADLFQNEPSNYICGYIEFDKHIYQIKCIEDLDNIYNTVKNKKKA